MIYNRGSKETRGSYLNLEFWREKQCNRCDSQANQKHTVIPGDEMKQPMNIMKKFDQFIPFGMNIILSIIFIKADII